MLPPSFRHRVGERRTRVGNRARDRDHPAAGRRRVFAAALAVLVVIGAVWLVAGLFLVHRRDRRHADFPARVVRGAGAARMPRGIQPCQQRAVAGAEAASVQASALALVAILILSPWDLGDILIALGARHSVRGGGLTRMVTAWYVRFPGWQVTLCGGALMLLLAVTFVVPWQPGYVDAIPYCIGIGLTASGLALVRAGLGLRGWPAGSAIAPHLVHARSGGAGLQLPPVPPTPPGHQPLDRAGLDRAGHGRPSGRAPPPCSTATSPPSMPTARSRPVIPPWSWPGSLCQPLSGGGDRPLADRVPASVPRDAGQ